MRMPLAIAVIALALAGCAEADQLRVSDGWIRVNPVAGRPAAAYFTLHGGPEPVQLINVATSIAIRSAMHETIAGEGGMMAMKPITLIAVPAGGEVVFAPGGRHVMLYNLNPGILPGKVVPMIFTFSDGTRIQYDTIVRGAADGPPE